MTTTRRGAPARARIRPHGLGDGARLRRDRSMLADAQRRHNAVAEEGGDVSEGTPLPNPPSRSALRRTSPPSDDRLTPLTLEARALYEARVVPVREVARLCGVSVAGLYYHVRRQGWRRRRSAVPRDKAKSERQRLRYQALKAQRPSSPRGLKARDPAAHAEALRAAQRAGALSGAALARAIARQDAEAKARMLALLTRALRDLSIADGRRKARTKESAPRKKESKPRARRRYEWRPHGEPPAWADRRR